MSNKLDFSVFQQNGQNLVELALQNSNNTVSKKTVLLDDFIKHISNYNNENLLKDSGYRHPNLIRELIKGSRTTKLYFFPQIKINPQFQEPRTNLTWLTTLGSDDIKFERNKINNAVLSNILLIVLYDNVSNRLMSYSVNHVASINSFVNTVDDNSIYIRSLYPNHYSNSICWGTTSYDNRMNEELKKGNVDILASIPHIYFNSTFNRDLFNDSESVRRFSKEVYDYVIKFYSEKSGIPEEELKTKLTDVIYISNDRYYIASDPYAFTFLLNALSFNPDMSCAYLSGVANRTSSCTVKQLVDNYTNGTSD